MEHADCGGLVSPKCFVSLRFRDREPDGLWLCTGEMSSTVELWDPFSGQKVFDVGKHASNIISTVKFSSNGRSLLSGAKQSPERFSEVSR